MVEDQSLDYSHEDILSTSWKGNPTNLDRFRKPFQLSRSGKKKKRNDSQPKGVG